MSICIINGKNYDVNVTKIKESFEKLYTANTKRTLDKGSMFLDPIGTFIGHEVEFAPMSNPDDFYVLWDFLKLPHTEGFPVELADGKTTIAYNAYVSNGSRELAFVRNDINYWDNFSAHFIPVDAQITP